MADHREIELKLHVPDDRVAAIRTAIEGRNGAVRTHLRATYHDTPDMALATAGMGWRVRHEGRKWSQTLKAQLPHGGDALARVEHNVALTARSEPAADASLHEGTPAGDLLAEVLDKKYGEVVEQFHTDIWRHTREVRAPGGVVELAFDTGVITSGERSVAVNEVEIELVRGRHHAVVQTARQWVERHGLWVDATGKAQRGVMLCTGATELPLVKVPTPKLHRRMSVDGALREITRACLVAIMGNASAVAAGFGGHEHVHQARIGIRKLRSALKVFGGYSTAVDPTWARQLAVVFTRLGEARDREVVLHEWIAALEEAGAPRVAPPPAEHDDPADVLRDPAFSLLLLDLLDYVHSEPLAIEGDLRATVALELGALRRKSFKHAKTFAELPAEEQHSVRKRVKRLRYIAELTASLFDAKDVRRYVEALVPAQEALGVMNDAGVAGDLYRAVIATDPQAWFAVGWLSSRRDDLAADCVRPLRAAKKAKPYWR